MPATMEIQVQVYKAIKNKKKTTKKERPAISTYQNYLVGFPGGAVVENLPAGARDAGSGPGLGGSHMPRST